MPATDEMETDLPANADKRDKTNAFTIPGTPPVQRTYADLIVDYLCSIDVEFIFGVPGGAIEPLYNALARSEWPVRVLTGGQEDGMGFRSRMRRSRRTCRRIRPVVARHESGAASMADGYARETGRIGVCCATTGPGTTNLITGVASAYADEVPLLVLTPQTALPSFGKCGLQESSADAIDTVHMFESCTRYNTLVSHPDQLERKLVAALAAAYRLPSGPVHISVPMDILRMPIGERRPRYNAATMLRQPVMTDEPSVDVLCEAVVNTLLKKERKIVLFIGHRCGGAIREVMAFAELVAAAFVSTPTGKRWVNARHPLYRGVFGFSGHQSASDALLDEKVELILAIGTDLGELSTNGWDEAALLNNKLVHIEPSMQCFEHSPMACLHVYAHLATVFNTLHSVVKHTPGLQHRQVDLRDYGFYSRWPGLTPPGIILEDEESCHSTAVPLKPQALICELVNRMPDDTRFLVDAGNAWCWATHYMHTKRTGTYRIAMGFGAMGWAIGAAVGTAMGSQGAPVVCMTGDGSFLMSGQEITVALMEKQPVIYVIFNDQSLGMVKHGQRLGGAAQIAYQLPQVNYALMAEAMGALGYVIETIDQLQSLDFALLLAGDKPVLLDVHIDPEEVPPMKARVKVLSKPREG